jgi:hypothetical protein
MIIPKSYHIVGSVVIILYICVILEEYAMMRHILIYIENGVGGVQIVVNTIIKDMILRKQIII